MKRFDYNQSRYHQLLAEIPLGTIAMQLRLPVTACAAALLAVAAAWSLETHRIAALDLELSQMQLRVQATAADEARVERLTSAVAHQRAIQDGIAAARRDVLETTNTVARIGNELPEQTWLTAVSSTPAGAWTVGGRSTHVGEIGTMLRRVQGIDPKSTARLVSIAATGRSGRILDFIIAWDRNP